MSQPQHADLLIVGGGVAAARTARGLRRGGFDGSILLVGEETLPPYNRPPLSKELLLSPEPLPDDLLLAEPRSWYERQRVELRTGTRVVTLDTGARRATLDDGAEVAFERCVLATGAVARRLPIPGGEAALMLRTAADARRLEKAFAMGRGSEVVVVGGGFIGLEVASALAARGLRPTLVELAPTLWGGALGAALAARVRDMLGAAGVVVRTGLAVTSISDAGVRAGEELLPAAFVVAGVGVAPRDELAAAAGIAVRDGVLTDAAGRSSHPAVWAAGDVARVDGLRVEHWHAAREAGTRVAAALLGAQVPPRRAPWIFSELAGSSLDVFGVATSWDEERWLGDGSALAYLVAGRVVQLAAFGGAIAPEAGRLLVERGLAIGAVERVLAGEPVSG
jgi:NADPH-dependent 2,4-dienoyl-CoA reductase/sulfur reductase-like enzyme